MRIGAIAVVGVLLLSGVDGATAAQPVRWSDCGQGFECTTVTVPLDYDEPGGAQIELAVRRHPATDPEHRIGSLFVNPGGPGPAGTLLPTVYRLVPKPLRERFDIVSFDPRGIGASTPVQCFDTAAHEDAFLSQLPAFPVGAEQEGQWIRSWATYARHCAEHDEIGMLEHQSTANTARDLERLRLALGDATLHYLGSSWGTIVGEIYANLYPSTAGRLVLDGALDPSAYTASRGVSHALSTSLRLGSDLAAARTLRGFLDLCADAGKPACAFAAGDRAATRAKFAELLERTPDYASTVASAQGMLSTARAIPGLVPGWIEAAQQLQQLWNGARSYPSEGQYLGVQCADSRGPQGGDRYRRLARLAEARSGPIGPVSVWADSRCLGWSAVDRDRYDGPWDRPTAGPILLVANTGDPTTPYGGSVSAASQLAHTRLLTVDQYGHTALTNPSSCANRAMAAYLIRGELPPPGAVCLPDRQPFEWG